jgi:hypothetical protein
MVHSGEDKAMNWHRGFLRLWVVLSILWLAGTAVILGPIIFEEWDVARRMKEFDQEKFVVLVPVDCNSAVVGREP